MTNGRSTSTGPPPSVPTPTVQASGTVNVTPCTVTCLVVAAGGDEAAVVSGGVGPVVGATNDAVGAGPPLVPAGVSGRRWESIVSVASTVAPTTTATSAAATTDSPTHRRRIGCTVAIRSVAGNGGTAQLSGRRFCASDENVARNNASSSSSRSSTWFWFIGSPPGWCAGWPWLGWPTS